MPVLVHGKDASATPFRELTRADSLNANGAQLTLSCRVERQQILLVENKNTTEEEECRVVKADAAENGKWKVGVEFTRRAERFWEIYFPPLLRTRQ